MSERDVSSEGASLILTQGGSSTPGGTTPRAQQKPDLRFIIQTGTIRETTAYRSRIRFLPTRHVSTRPLLSHFP